LKKKIKKLKHLWPPFEKHSYSAIYKYILASLLSTPKKVVKT